MAQNSTEAILTQREDGQELIVFPAPNDGSIIELIDTQIGVRFDGEKIEWNKRDFHIRDENGNLHILSLTGKEVFNTIISIYNQQLQELQKREEKALKLVTKYKKMIANRPTPPQKEKNCKEEIEELQKEIEIYENIYGNSDTPTLIIVELYKGGTIGKGRQLVAPQKFRHRHINTSNPKNREKTNFWLALYEDWGIIDSDGNIRYAKVTFEKAKKILREKIGEV